MEPQFFTKYSVEGITVEEVNGQFVLTGFDETAAAALRNFLNRPAVITIEPLDVRSLGTVEAVNGQFVLTGFDETVAAALRNFLNRSAVITIEPLDVRSLGTVEAVNESAVSV